MIPGTSVPSLGTVATGRCTESLWAPGTGPDTCYLINNTSTDTTVGTTTRIKHNLDTNGAIPVLWLKDGLEKS